MYEICPLRPSDIFNFDLPNLDKTTENYSIEYYMHYLLNHSDDAYCVKRCESQQNKESTHPTEKRDNVLAYLIGKHEFKAQEWTGHVTSLTVCPQFRRFSFGKFLMAILEDNGRKSGAKFVDLYVRESNTKARAFYTKLGYSGYARVNKYYSDPEEDAFDMRLYLTKE